MKTTISRLYDSYDAAANAVNGLVDAGVPHEDISIVASNAEGRTVPTVVETTDAGGGAGTGAGIGGLLGGGAGLLAGLGMLAIPGLGPVVAAGWLAATAAGAVAGVAAGAVTGGIIGALTGAGVSEEHAHVYAEGVRRGGALVTARVEDDRLTAANAILDRHGAIDPDERARLYRDSGWDRFDERADPYTAEQIARERRLYERGPMV
ncbi:hypothetical protein STVA_36850 [Allostella vacuolata]|nr:hypothetical protein STVA_36850 [Stella vacuolata]